MPGACGEIVLWPNLCIPQEGGPFLAVQMSGGTPPLWPLAWVRLADTVKVCQRKQANRQISKQYFLLGQFDCGHLLTLETVKKRLENGMRGVHLFPHMIYILSFSPQVRLPNEINF